MIGDQIGGCRRLFLDFEKLLDVCPAPFHQPLELWEVRNMPLFHLLKVLKGMLMSAAASRRLNPRLPRSAATRRPRSLRSSLFDAMLPSVLENGTPSPAGVSHITEVDTKRRIRIILLLYLKRYLYDLLVHKEMNK